MSDAAILSTQCDGVILVLRAQRTTTAVVRRLVVGLDMVGARILGAVLNGIDLRSPVYSDYRSPYTYYNTAIRKGDQN